MRKMPNGDLHTSADHLIGSFGNEDSPVAPSFAGP
jgi:hypothetical protein